MKFTYLAGAAALITFVIACSNNTVQKNISGNTGHKVETEIYWRDTVINLGTVKTGETKNLTFVCENKGRIPLIFENIESTCGCTVITKKINEPVRPNGIDSITAEFKMSTQTGYTVRKIYVLSNAKPGFHVLKIIADVQS